MDIQLLYGSSVLANDIPKFDAPVISYPGRSLHQAEALQLNGDILSKHLLVLGSSGYGKTNVFLWTIAALRNGMTTEDILIIFDTKGEFLREFYQPGDYLISNSLSLREQSMVWNIYGEVLADGWEEESVRINASEIAHSLFKGRGSTHQPFFVNAARDVFQSVLILAVRNAKRDPHKQADLNNEGLLKTLFGSSISEIAAIFAAESDMRYLLTYLGDGRSSQGIGVISELNSMLSEFFTGVFAKSDPVNEISMRRAVRQKNRKALFIEYDLAVGETFTPMYRLLIDQALKEALSRMKDSGHVYFIVDEFKLLPQLHHIDDALNFGRGLGVRVMAGIQSIDQLYDLYGERKGAVLAGGFGNLIAFRSSDYPSRRYVTERFGQNKTIVDFINDSTLKYQQISRDGHTVEEWDQLGLSVGHAVVGLCQFPPFLFNFAQYKEEHI